MGQSTSPSTPRDDISQKPESDAIPFDKFMPWHLFWRDAILRSIKPIDYEYLEDPGFDTDLSKYNNYCYTAIGERLPWADEKKEILQNIRSEWKKMFQYFEQAGGHRLEIPENTPRLLKMAYTYGHLERRAWNEYSNLKWQSGPTI
ncbi:hypothetical protein EYR41_004554 [Orbilia oligospora]|uniref:Uncharacterized protein n=1 Tax=Orbilia oligospora TaxID=2813651 RepID=A0A7C8PFF8_ORBOL|nr:hypothetical protein TWF751_005315 [Orbilia oligospora]TGJ72677.1 hypothetical protein EYR41_004554 [Orbilia oligospora]